MRLRMESQYSTTMPTTEALLITNPGNKSTRHVDKRLPFAVLMHTVKNGVAKRKSRELQDHAHTMLIHANKRWPHAINTHLGPYTLRRVNDILNAKLNLKTGNTPLNAFAQSDITSNPKHWYPFGCPVYVLDSNLQAVRK